MVRTRKQESRHRYHERVENNPEYRHREHVRRAQFVTDYKRQHGCALCGENHPACLDFHHKNPAEKLFSVNRATHKSRERIFAEIVKCVILCSNCHRKLHWSDNDEVS